METTLEFIEYQADATIPRRGGIILKGKARSERQAVSLLFLIDTSGSMESEHKLENVIKSMNFILPFLTERDQISLVTFDDTAKLYLSNVSVTSNEKSALEYKMSQIHSDGSTNMSAGLIQASSVFDSPATDTIERKKGLIMLTDGHANIGVVEPPLLVNLIKNIISKNPGLSITTVGYGDDHNADLLSKMAIEGGGSYNIVKNLEDVASVFGEILGGLLSVSAQMIEVILPAGAKTDTLFSKEVLSDGTTKVRIGDLYAESEQTLLFDSCPNLGAVQIKGVGLPDFNPIEISQVPTILLQGSEPNPTLQMAEYRQQVSNLLRETRTGHITQASKDKAKVLKELLEAERYKTDPLAKMMIEDLTHILDFVEHPQRMDNHLTSALTQHETYLGVARGLRSPSHQINRQHRVRHYTPGFSNATTDEDQTVPAQAPDLQATTSIFSNAVQRHITNVLRTMSNRESDQDPNSQDSHDQV